MFDFRLEVFYTVAKRLSFTKAAAELFERKGNHIVLTQAGALLLHHAERVFELYCMVEFDINALIKRKEGLL